MRVEFKIYFTSKRISLCLWHEESYNELYDYFINGNGKYKRYTLAKKFNRDATCFNLDSIESIEFIAKYEDPTE